jgi:sigma-B regulation protein RsbU (phosphoserine phosphatase)
MEYASLDGLRQQLTERQSRLRGALSGPGPAEEIVRLLKQVDTALDRLGTEDYARCLVCNGHVDEKDLRLNPLLEYCLCDLTPAQQRELEHDLELARRIQTALLPDPALASDGWEASYHYEPLGVVSGDYCDLWISPAGEGSIHFAVGDVSGKGVAASLLMAHLQAAFRSLVGAGVPLAELVERVNRQLLEAGIPTHYATLACGRVDSDGRMDIVNAGHTPPLVMRKGRVEELGPTGFPVGLLTDRPYDIHTLTLEPGESLVLYTDGLTEAREAGGDEYGPERLSKLLSRETRDATSRELLKAVRDDLDRFLAGEKCLDDLTVLVLRRSA